MKATMILTAACLFLTACGGAGGGSSNSSAQTSGTVGTYILTATRPNGDNVISVLTLDGSNYKVRNYTYIGGNRVHGTYREAVGVYSVTGMYYTVTFARVACAQSFSETFPITPQADGSILVHSNASNVDARMVPITESGQAFLDTTSMPDPSCPM